MPFSIGNMSQVIFREFHSERIKLPRVLRECFVEALHDMTEQMHPNHGGRRRDECEIR